MWLASLLLGWLWRLSFATKFIGDKFTSSLLLVPSETSPARRTLCRSIVQRSATLRAPDTGVDERTGNHSNRTEHQAQKETEGRVVSLAGNDDAGGNGCDPDPQAQKFHHPHPFSTHISSRIGPATMQAFRSRAIRRDGSMGLASTLSLWVSTETTTRILAVVFLLRQLSQCFWRDSRILALGRSEILTE